MMVSVCMATYNGELYIKEQIDSILAQLACDDELVISDDGSTDNTLNIIASYNDERIRLFHNNAHNFKWNFVNALENARGKYIFLSDQDDVWLPGKYARCLELLEVYDLVVTDSIMTDENLVVQVKSFFKFYHSGAGLLKNACYNTYFGSCMAFRREILQHALPFPKTKEIGHDIWLGLVAEIVGKPYFLNEPYLYYRRHSLALSNDLQKSIFIRSKRSIFVKVFSRIVVLFVVFRFYLKYHATQIGIHNNTSI